MLESGALDLRDNGGADIVDLPHWSTFRIVHAARLAPSSRPKRRRTAVRVGKLQRCRLDRR